MRARLWKSARYEFVEDLGEGGMAAVVRARDRVLSRDVAIKLLKTGDDDRERAQRLFESEYLTLARLAHPRIITVYDYQVDADGPFYSMELLDGKDLRERAPVPWELACRYLRDVASSIALLHARGLVHRDITPRNIRCTSDGRAKLIDFGALTQAHDVREVVGTPPFVPPEAFEQKPLDGRADLFSLGATAYFVLTGRQAYGARSFSALPRAWRTTPRPLRGFVPEIPEQLDRLVMSLLSLDKHGRPESVMDVIEILSAVAGLPDDEIRDIQKSFLSTPELVGRKSLMKRTTRLIGAVRSGEDACLVVRGPTGVGRSRALDEIALSASLGGLLVLRAGESQAQRGDFGIAHHLMTLLRQEIPETQIGLDERLIEWLESGKSPSLSRGEILERIRDALVRAAEHRPLLLVVDDVHAVDEPSTALLALIAREGRNSPIGVVAALRDGEATTDAIEALVRSADVETLRNLSRRHVEALMASVFGASTANLRSVASDVLRESQGSPASAVYLMEHLVDRRLARYERGAWILPDTLAPGDLPHGLGAVISARIERLGEEARRIAKALAIARVPVSPDECSEISSVSDTERAVRELVHERFIDTSDGTYRLRQFALARALCDAMSAEERHTLHARTAHTFQNHGRHPVHVASHLLDADQVEDAISIAHRFAADLTASGARFDPGWLETATSVLDEAVTHAARLGKPPLVIAELRQALVASTLAGNIDAALRHGPELEERLRIDLGVIYWDELGPEATLSERRQHGMARAHEVHEQTPESQRGLSPFAALYALGRYCMYGLVPAGLTLSIDLHEQLLKLLTPFIELSPIFEVVAEYVRAGLAMTRGLYGTGRAHYARTLEILERARDSGLREAEFHQMRLGLLNLLSQVSLSTSSHDPAWLRDLQASPMHEADAWRLREAAATLACDLTEANRCSGEAELARLRHSGARALPGGTAALQVLTAVRLMSIARLRDAEATVTPFAEHYNAYVPYLLLARGVRRHLTGDLGGAVADLEEAHRTAPIAQHPQGHIIARWYVRALIAAGERERASEAARDVSRDAEARGFSDGNTDHPAPLDLDLGSALAAAASGERERAEKLWRSVLERATELRVPPLLEAEYCEWSSLIASLCEDRTGATLLVERLEKLRQTSGGDVLLGRIATARQRRETLSDRAATDPGYAPLASADYRSRLSAARTTADQMHLGLQLLVEATRSAHGYLFTVRKSDYLLCARTTNEPFPETLLSVIEGQIALARQSCQTDTRTESGGASQGQTVSPQSSRTSISGTTYRVFPLHMGDGVVAGVVVLARPSNDEVAPASLTTALAEVLAQEAYPA